MARVANCFGLIRMKDEAELIVEGEDEVLEMLGRIWEE